MVGEEPCRARRRVVVVGNPGFLQIHPAVEDLPGVEDDRAARPRANVTLHDASVRLLDGLLPRSHLVRPRDQVGATTEARLRGQERPDDISGGLRVRGKPPVHQREAFR